MTFQTALHSCRSRINVLENLTKLTTSKEENKISGCLLDPRGMLVTMYVNDKYKK